MKRNKALQAATTACCTFTFLIIAFSVPISLHRSLLESARLPLSKDDSRYNAWADSTHEDNQEVYWEFYAFNITNPNAVLAGSAPEVEELGPWVYKFDSTKYDVSWDGDEVSYRDYKTFTFNKERSGTLSENDRLSLFSSGYDGLLHAINNNDDLLSVAATALGVRGFVSGLEDNMPGIAAQGMGVAHQEIFKQGCTVYRNVIGRYFPDFPAQLTDARCADVFDPVGGLRDADPATNVFSSCAIPALTDQAAFMASGDVSRITAKFDWMTDELARSQCVGAAKWVLIGLSTEAGYGVLEEATSQELVCAHWRDPAVLGGSVQGPLGFAMPPEYGAYLASQSLATSLDRSEACALLSYWTKHEDALGNVGAFIAATTALSNASATPEMQAAALAAASRATGNVTSSPAEIERLGQYLKAFNEQVVVPGLYAEGGYLTVGGGSSYLDNRKVGQWIFDYNDPLISLYSGSPTNTAVLERFHQTGPEPNDLITIVNTGKSKIKDAHQLVQADGMTTLKVWKTEEKIQGTLGTNYGPQAIDTDTKDHYVFNSYLTRALKTKYLEDTEVKGVPTKRMIVDPVEWDPNPQYFSDIKGAWNQTSNFRANVIVTRPRFLDAESLQEQDIVGVPAPNADAHANWDDVEPNTGYVIRAQAGFQFNLKIGPTISPRFYPNVPDLVMPVAYFVARAELSDESAAKLAAFWAGYYAAIVVAIIVCLCCCGLTVFFAYQAMQSEELKPLDEEIVSTETYEEEVEGDDGDEAEEDNEESSEM